MRYTVFCFLIMLFWCSAAYAQHDTTLAKDKSILNPVDPKTVNPFLPDSLVKQGRQKFMEDSIAMVYLMPDSLRVNQVFDNILKTNLYHVLLQAPAQLEKKNAELRGFVRNSRASWIIVVVIGLLIYTGLLNLFLGNDLKSVWQSFYSKQALSQTDKEGGLINSWAFIGLFILFSLSMGLVVYQLTQYYNMAYSLSGVGLFLVFSAIIGILLALKFVLLKFIGFIFQIDAVVSEYIAVLNLTYFNMAFLLLAVAMCFSLLASHFIPLLLNFTLGLTVVIFLWQYVRNSLKIISDFRFHKFYLFVYLCALEFCPVLVLIKALNK